MKMLRVERGGWFLGALLGGLLAGCSSSDSSAPGGCPSCGGAGGGFPVDAADRYVSDAVVYPPTEAGTDAAPSTRNHLCGQGLCDPGYSGACGPTPKPPDAGTPDVADASASSADAANATSPDASVPQPADAPSEAGGDDASAITPHGDGAAWDADDAAMPRACHLRVGEHVTSVCEDTGWSESGSSCRDSRDCAPGLGCVEQTDTGAEGAGVCRPFSCTLPTNCPSGTFYQELPLRQSGTNAGVNVPVCTPVDNCQLLSDSCPGDRACSIVGDDATSCLVPGEANQNDPCSDETRCARDLVCSKTTNRCIRLCHTDRTDECAITCQGGSNAFPSGIGACVGDTADAN